MIITIPTNPDPPLHSLSYMSKVRKIQFKQGDRFAVVLASYCGSHTTHKTAKEALQRSLATRDLHKIIDREGLIYGAFGDTLITQGESI